jgi:hypothetical protein
MMQQACHAAVPVSCRYVRTEYLQIAFNLSAKELASTESAGRKAASRGR